jgi:hypothetical protein
MSATTKACPEAPYITNFCCIIDLSIENGSYLSIIILHIFSTTSICKSGKIGKHNTDFATSMAVGRFSGAAEGNALYGGN